MGHRRNCDRFCTLVTGYPVYSLIWIGGIFSLMGDYFNTIATWNILNSLGKDEGALFIMGYNVVQRLPPIFMAPIVSRTIDKLDGRFTMIVCDLMRVPLSLSYILIKDRRHLPYLFIISAVKNCFNSYHSPSRRRLIPQVVPDTILSLCALIDGVTYSSVLGVASALGGITTSALGPKICFTADAASYLLSATCTLLMMLPCTAPSKRAQTKIATEANIDSDDDDAEYDMEDDDQPNKDGTTTGNAGEVAAAPANPTNPMQPIANETTQPMIPSTAILAKREDRSVIDLEIWGAASAKGLSALLYGSMSLFMINWTSNPTYGWVLGNQGSVGQGLLQLERGLAEMAVPIVTESLVLPSHKKTRRSTVARVMVAGFVIETIGIGLMFGSTVFGAVAGRGSWELVVKVVLFMLGNAIRCSGESNIWVFSCLLVPLTASEYGLRSELGKIFTRENWLASGGEILGTLASGFADYYLVAPKRIPVWGVTAAALLLSLLVTSSYVGFYMRHWRDQHKFMKRELKKAFTVPGKKRRGSRGSKQTRGVTRVGNSIQEANPSDWPSVYFSQGG